MAKNNLMIVGALVLAVILLNQAGLLSYGMNPEHGEDFRNYVCSHPPTASPNTDLVNQMKYCIPKTTAAGFPMVDKIYNHYLFASGCWSAQYCNFANWDRCDATYSADVAYASVYEASKTFSDVQPYFACTPAETPDQRCKRLDAHGYYNPNTNMCDCITGYEQYQGACRLGGSGNYCLENGVCEAGCTNDPDCGVPTTQPTVNPTVNPTIFPTVNPTIQPTVYPSPTPTTGLYTCPDGTIVKNTADCVELSACKNSVGILCNEADDITLLVIAGAIGVLILLGVSTKTGGGIFR